MKINYIILTILTFIVLTSFVGASELVNRTATSDIYYNAETDSYSAQLYSKPINMIARDGTYKPYEEVTRITELDGNIFITWWDGKQDRTLILQSYIVEKGFTEEKNVATLSKSSSDNLALKTELIDERGSLRWYHNLTTNISKQPIQYGYKLAGDSRDCYTEGLSIICGEQSINFNEAVEVQGYNVSIQKETMQVKIEPKNSTTDFSYIDPTITLDSGDLWIGDYQVGAQKSDDGGDISYDYGWYDSTYSPDAGYDNHGISVEYWEVSRGYNLFTTSDINTNWIINSVHWNFYVNLIHADAGSYCNDLDIMVADEDDATDWSPSSGSEAADISMAIHNGNQVISAFNSIEDVYNDANLGSYGVSQMEHAVDNSEHFVVGYKLDVDTDLQGDPDQEGADDCYISVAGEGWGSNQEPYIVVDYTLPDTTAPTTTASGKYATNGSTYTFGTTSYSQAINVTLSCSDGGVGCQSTYYCKDTNNTCTPTTTYSAPFQVTTAGLSYIRYYSKDNNNNQETAKYQNITIVYDTIPPVLTFNSLSTMDSSQVVYFNVTATDETNLSHCTFTLYDLAGSIAGYNNTIFIQGTLSQFSTPAFANYNLFTICYDLAGNQDNETTNFGTSAGSSSGGSVSPIGGGGFASPIFDKLITNKTIAPNLENKLLEYLSTGAFTISGVTLTWFTLFLVIAIALIILAEINSKKPLKVLK